MIWRLIRTQLRGHLANLLFMLLIAGIVSSTPYAFSFLGKWLVDEALQVTDSPKFETRESEPTAISPDQLRLEWKAKTTEEKIRLLLIFLVASLVIHIVTTGLSMLSAYLNTRVIQRTTYNLRSEVREKIAGLDEGLFRREQVGQLMTRIMDDTSGLPGNLTNLVVNSFTQVAMLGLGAYLLFSLNAKLAPIALMALPFYGLICAIFLPRIKRNAADLRTRGAAFNGFVVERLSNVETIKNYAQEDREVRQFGSILDENMDLQGSQQRLTLGFGTLTGLIRSVGTIAVLAFGFMNIKSGRMQLGETMAFYQITSQLFVPIGALVGMTTVAQTLQILGKRVFDILDLPARLPKGCDGDAPLGLEGDVVFEDVSLRYEEGGPLEVTNVNLELPVGKTTCIVGAIGSGKATLLTLLSRLHDPTEGVITIGGVDIKQAPLRQLRLTIGNVFREPVIFTGTIADNISYGAPESTQADVEEITRLVDLHEFVEQQSEGYETILGHNGISLSEAELLKLSIARALLTNPTILTIDDTYASVSEDVERQLQTAISNRFSGRTIIVTASRLSICEDADKVVVMRNGQVEETGTHQELLARPSVYRRMYMRQMGIEKIDELVGPDEMKG